MLENFQLTVIARVQGEIRLFRIPLHQALQDALTESWNDQYEAFFSEVDEIDFDAGYKPEEHERFRLADYELPVWLADESSLTIPDLEPISAHDDVMETIRGVAAFARDDQGNELILFQNFTRSQVIRPGRFLFLKDDTYESAEHPGLTLDAKLTALYTIADSKLLFTNFRFTNTFLPLVEFYEEASEEQIREVLGHKKLAPADAGALAVGASQWFRKRFALLRDSGVLDKYSAKQIQARSKGYDVDIHLSGGKVVFPAEKAAAKKLLQFLNEEIYRGPITDTLYETNSKRIAD